MKRIDIINKLLIQTCFMILCFALSYCSTNDNGNNNSAQQTTSKNLMFECDYLGQQPPGREPTIFAPGIISTGKAFPAMIIQPGSRYEAASTIKSWS
jgi:hypothetical protein